MRLVQWCHITTCERSYSVCFEAREEAGLTSRTIRTTAVFKEIIDYAGPYDYYFETLAEATDWSCRHCQTLNRFLQGCYNAKK